MGQNKENKVEGCTFVPPTSDEGWICNGCPIKDNCPYPTGFGCASIMYVRKTRAEEMRKIRKCSVDTMTTMYSLLGGLSVSRVFNKGSRNGDGFIRITTRIKDHKPVHPDPKLKCECNSLMAVVLTKNETTRGRTSTEIRLEFVDFSDCVWLEYGYVNMDAVKSRLNERATAWHDTIVGERARRRAESRCD